MRRLVAGIAALGAPVALVRRSHTRRPIYALEVAVLERTLAVPVTVTVSRRRRRRRAACTTNTTSQLIDKSEPKSDFEIVLNGQ